MWWFVIFIIIGILVIAFFIDMRRKKNNNQPQIPTNPNAKPGESSIYTVADNRFTDGGE